MLLPYFLLYTCRLWNRIKEWCNFCRLSRKKKKSGTWIRWENRKGNKKTELHMGADGQSGWYREHEGVLKRDDSSPLNATVLFCLCLSCSYSLHMSVQTPHSFARGEDVWQDLGDGNSLSTLSGFKLCRNFFCKNPFGGSCHTGRIWVKFLYARTSLSVLLTRKLQHFKK